MPDEDKDETRTRQAPPCPGGFLYEIRSGDTLYALARRYGTSVEAITAANPGLNPNALRVGQLICIPAGGAVTPPVPPTAACPPGLTPYVIRSGDTLYRIAQRFGTSVDAIRRANPGVNPNSLQVGQLICVPSPTGAPAPGTCPGGMPYVIRAGDTLYGIAARFRTTVQAILRANPGIDPNRLSIGQTICVPRAMAPVPRPTACSIILQPVAGTTAPYAGGRLWLTIDPMGNAEITVAAENLPAPAAMGGAAYSAIINVDGTSFAVPMVETVAGRWAGTATRRAPAALLSRGRVNVYPGPVLTGWFSSCR